MKNVTFKVEGMRCNGCASTIEALLQRLPGVRRVAADFGAGEVRVLFEPDDLSEDQLAALLEKPGYRVVNRSAAP